MHLHIVFSLAHPRGRWAAGSSAAGGQRADPGALFTATAPGTSVFPLSETGVLGLCLLWGQEAYWWYWGAFGTSYKGGQSDRKSVV